MPSAHGLTRPSENSRDPDDRRACKTPPGLELLRTVLWILPGCSFRRGVSRAVYPPEAPAGSDPTCPDDATASSDLHLPAARRDRVGGSPGPGDRQVRNTLSPTKENPCSPSPASTRVTTAASPTPSTGPSA